MVMILTYVWRVCVKRSGYYGARKASRARSMCVAHLKKKEKVQP